MQILKSVFIFSLVVIGLLGCVRAPQIEPVGPLPSQRQLEWYEMEYYGFIHFNMNTFTNKEWGEGSESPDLFDPKNMDTDQWARVMKNAGMTGVIITAKHHDGFALWPTETTEHSVKNSPWKNGEGDIIKELAESCEKYGLKMGVYLSPWDRNHPDYGTDAYIEDFVTQLTELLSNYGPIFEVWFDGANGGSGYYGGANETRKIDHRTYYQWDRVFDTVRKYQPDAVIFGDNGPDVRWIGNEAGIAGETNWSIIKKDEVYAGSGRYAELQFGHEDGTHFVPGEVDVSIRPGWYYHPSEDNQVKNLNELLDIYYNSIGRNASLLLNVPVNDEGVIPEEDIVALNKLKERLDEVFNENIALSGNVEASSFRKGYEPNNVIDEVTGSFWMPTSGSNNPWLTINFEKEKLINRFVIQEFIEKGQRVKKFKVEAMIDGEWQIIEEQTTIGYKRILRLNALKTNEIRVTILEKKDTPLISNIGLYYAPPILDAPKISRNSRGEIEISSGPETKIFYEVNTSGKPDSSSKEYSEAFKFAESAQISAISYDPFTNKYSETSKVSINPAKNKWRPIDTTRNVIRKFYRIIDENPNSTGSFSMNKEILIDMGENRKLNGFSYLPPKDLTEQIITEYEFSTSEDGENWTVAKKGEFGNIKNNPILQEVRFKEREARYLRLKALQTVGSGEEYGISELAILNEKSE
ncbi:alpha-L-fucosidase [Autumnicola musiva]|uniref:alpha-L-fucosidase n=1 Tax=Autumnicola musiva TaxID=3075589 RepID=A0ABU3D2W2_9FLAO|nr:alpha-L-fucosidase [Zunongwangia sp. F117]MDT0675868.1 alpha-L-fucosidase [Zunongwangia sp. F117]